MDKYIWQLPAWNDATAPQFSWRASSLGESLGLLQSALDALVPPDANVVPDAQTQVHIDTLVQTAIRSSEIEGLSLIHI